jgi:hypothetical protein
MPFVGTLMGVTSTDQTKMYFQGLEEREREREREKEREEKGIL